MDDCKELALLLLQGSGKQARVKDKGSRSNIIAPVSSNQIKASIETAALLFKDPILVAMKLPEQIQQMLVKCIDTNVSVSDENVWRQFDADVLEEVLKLSSLDEQLAAVNRLLELKKRARIDNYSSSLLGIIRTIKRFGLSHPDDKLDGAKMKKAPKGKMTTDKETQIQIHDEEGFIEDSVVNDMDAIDDTLEISKLTGKPLSEDVLTHVIPVCGPYATLSQYKYRVKLVPGSQKRGKASKQCLELFLKYAKSENRDCELIKLMNENEMVQVLCGDVKIAVPGMSKLAKK